MLLAPRRQWNAPFPERCVMTRETFYVTSERGVCFKGHVYFCKGIGFTHVLCSRQEARYINTIFLRVSMSVCLCGCLSVNDSQLCASHLSLFRLFPHTCPSCPPTASNKPSSLSDTSRGLCEHHLSLSHEWLYLHGHWAFLETRKSALYKSLFLFLDEQHWWYFSSTGPAGSINSVSKAESIISSSWVLRACT